MSDALELETTARGHRVPKAAIWAGIAGGLGLVGGATWLATHGFLPIHPFVAQLVGVVIFAGGGYLVRREEKVRVRVTRDTIEVGRRRFGRAEIESATRKKLHEGLELTLVGPHVSLAVDEATANAILEKLELDVAHRVAKYTVPGRLAIMTPVFWNPAGYRLVVLAWLVPILALWRSIHAFPQVVAHGLIGLGLAFMALLIAPSTLQVGSDGFVVRWLGTRRYVAFAEVTSVDELQKLGMAALRFELRDGTSFTIVSGNDPKSDPILVRVREAMMVEGRATDIAKTQALVLERGALSARSWLEHLRAVGAGATASLRSADVDLDALWSVLDDPRASTTRRIGAAIALAERGGEGTPERLRVATEASASPRLRTAVEATVKHDEEALLAAIEEEIAEEERREHTA